MDDRACKTAVLMLGRQSYSSGRLFEKLLEKGYDEPSAAEAVAWCVERRYLDDETLCRRIIEQKAAGGHGERRIRDFLRSKVFDAELIDRSWETFAESRDPEEAAEKLMALCRKLHKGDVWDAREKARVSAALARRGFGWDEINEAVRGASEE